MIEALLDPSLMRVAVADTSTLPADQRDTRIRNVEDYFTDNGLGFVLVPAEAAPPARRTGWTGGPDDHRQRAVPAIGPLHRLPRRDVQAGLRVTPYRHSITVTINDSHFRNLNKINSLWVAHPGEALIYNWRSLFVRLADPEHHREAITS